MKTYTIERCNYTDWSDDIKSYEGVEVHEDLGNLEPEKALTKQMERDGVDEACIESMRENFNIEFDED